MTGLTDLEHTLITVICIMGCLLIVVPPFCYLLGRLHERDRRER